MTLQQIRYFDAVVRTGSLVRAADRLFISQPSLSVAISNLEKELGVPLFERQGRSVRLTAEGKEFVPHAQQILRAVEEASVHMNALSQSAAHHLRLGYVSPLADWYIPALMRDFLQQPENKDTVLDFACGTTDELVRGLKNGVFDLLVCSHPGEDEALRKTVLLEQPLELISPSDAPCEIGALPQLQEMPLIGYPQGGAMDSYLSWFQKKESLQLNFICRAPNEEAIAALCENHFGCAVVAAVDGLKGCPVHRQLLPGGYTRKIYCVTLASRRYYGVASRFIRYMFGEREQEKYHGH